LSELKLYPGEQVQAVSEVETALRALADYEAGARNTGRAIEIYAGPLDRILAGESKPATVLADALHVSRIWSAKAALHRLEGRTDLAGALEAKRRDLWRHWRGAAPDSSFIRRQLEASALR
jgi:hypothetical protein